MEWHSFYLLLLYKFIKIHEERDRVSTFDFGSALAEFGINDKDKFFFRGHYEVGENNSFAHLYLSRIADPIKVWPTKLCNSLASAHTFCAKYDHFFSFLVHAEAAASKAYSSCAVESFFGKMINEITWIPTSSAMLAKAAFLLNQLMITFFWGPRAPKVAANGRLQRRSSTRHFWQQEQRAQIRKPSQLSARPVCELAEWQVQCFSFCLSFFFKQKIMVHTVRKWKKIWIFHHNSSVWSSLECWKNPLFVDIF